MKGDCYFTNGDIRRYDISPAVRRGGCYAPLANVKVLKNALTVYEGTLAFDLTGKRDSCEIIHFCAIRSTKTGRWSKAAKNDIMWVFSSWVSYALD